MIGLPAPGMECDEYPSASTLEGGFNSSIEAVNEAEHRLQTNLHSIFYRDANFSRVQWFAVAVTWL